MPAVFAAIASFLAGAGSSLVSSAPGIVEVALSIGKIFIRAGFLLATILAFILVLNMAIAGFGTLLDGTVLADIFAFTQLWLPFNLNSILTWIVTGSLTLFGYRIAVVIYHWTKNLLGDS